MSDALTAVYGALFKPRETFVEELSYRPAVLVVLVVALVGAFALSAGNAGLLTLAFFTALGWTLWLWLVSSAMLFLVVRMLYRVGEFQAIGAAVGLAMAPWMLLGPAQALLKLGNPGVGLAMLAEVILAIWWLRLMLLGLRGATGITVAQALWAFVAAELMVIALPMVGLLLAGFSLGLAFSSVM